VLALIHVTIGIIDFLMTLLRAGAWAFAWIAGAILLSATIIVGSVMLVRAIWRRRRAGE
jgi:hypothetical protein